jgi:hypothetical protein
MINFGSTLGVSTPTPDWPVDPPGLPGAPGVAVVPFSGVAVPSCAIAGASKSSATAMAAMASFMTSPERPACAVSVDWPPAVKSSHDQCVTSVLDSLIPSM